MWPIHEFIKGHPIIFINMLVIPIVVPCMGNIFHLQLDSVPMVNTMIHNTMQIQMTNPCLVTTNDEQYYVCPMDLKIMKCLVSKQHFCSCSGSLYPRKNNKGCALAIYFENNQGIKIYCSISVNNIPRNS